METLEHMARLANDPNARAVLDLILVYPLPSGELIPAIDHWVRGHFRYRSEHEEVLRTVSFMLGEIAEKGFFEGDCDDCATLTAAVLKVFGCMVRFVAIRYDSKDFQHVFVECYSDDRAGWVALDATVNPGTEYREIERMVLSV